MYGTMGNQEAGTFFIPGKRRRLNWVGLVVTLLVGPAVFIYVISVLCSEYRFHHPNRARALVGAAVLVTLVEFLVAKSYRVRDRQPMWLGWIFITMVMALVCGIFAGQLMYDWYMLPFFNAISLHEYPNVNVGTETGEQYLDAGFIGFSDGSELDLYMPGQYRHGDLYCVVPIVNKKVDGGVPKTGTYDFWAVGKNCCGDPVGVFRCGDWHNPAARSGLREISLEDHDDYLLAVKQAATTYNIESNYPILVQWLQNPLDVVLAYAKDGEEMYKLWIGGFVLFNCMVTFVAMLFFSRIGKLDWGGAGDKDPGAWFDFDDDF